MAEITGENLKEGRVARRQRRNREALIRAASDVMSEKGIDAATMLEIADRADVGAGTVYNYFRSKDDLAVAVLEEIMQDLALRVETATGDFADPAHVYAVALLTVLETATNDERWRQLLNRSGIVADVMFRRIGPFAIDLLKQGAGSGRLSPGDAALTWRLTTHAIVGIGLSVSHGDLPASAMSDAAVRLLCMVGLSAEVAQDLAARPLPTLPPEDGLNSIAVNAG
ncbi:TetR/AcrR family transcriptional regulator [Pseudooceanicola spongiae]|uniref:TetR family transcriptional regulator n=1 Tax=Pseudooceanicola spongiae TaxID=2613965 RepID=A0A7L9WQ42_9RHOB|nr:TetR/AcrR family transcriptional regulator [Pseudooceanicola spongiae]QOL81837.1 TetR family transcriptional regulator [Pseudooceanicola spongiae]